MNLGEFHDEVRKTVARGAAMDSFIPSMTKRSARWLERNYTFQYMKRFGTVKINKDANQPRAIQMPFAALIKKLVSVRLVVENTDMTSPGFCYLRQVDPQEVRAYGKGRPMRFWLDGVNWLWLDTVPAEDYSLEIMAEIYTDWPKDLRSEHWLLTNAEDVLLAQTMMYMASPMRDMDILAQWKPMRDESLNTLIGANEDLQSEPSQMEFATDVRDWLEPMEFDSDR